jgi:acyl carrier protein
MMRLEIGSAVEQIVSAVLAKHAGHGDIDVITRDATLHDELGMDEADLIEVMLRAEDRFGVTLPDDAIGFSSTVTDIVDLITMRMSEKAAQVQPLAPVRLPSPSIAPDA